MTNINHNEVEQQTIAVVGIGISTTETAIRANLEITEPVWDIDWEEEAENRLAVDDVVKLRIYGNMFTEPPWSYCLLATDERSFESYIRGLGFEETIQNIQEWLTF